DLLGDESIKSIPSQFAITNGLAKDQKMSIEIARILIDQMSRYEKLNLDLTGITPLDKDMQKFIFENLEYYEKNIKIIQKRIETKAKLLRPIGPIRVTVNDPNCRTCQYEESRFNPTFWNANNHVRYNNNCYNYGRNWKTNTFAQPGRASG